VKSQSIGPALADHRVVLSMQRRAVGSQLEGHRSRTDHGREHERDREGCAGRVQGDSQEPAHGDVERSAPDRLARPDSGLPRTSQDDERGPEEQQHSNDRPGTGHTRHRGRRLLSNAHRDRALCGSGEPVELATRCTHELDRVGDVEEAIDLEVASGRAEARERGVPRAR